MSEIPIQLVAVATRWFFILTWSYFARLKTYWHSSLVCLELVIHSFAARLRICSFTMSSCQMETSCLRHLFTAWIFNITDVKHEVTFLAAHSTMPQFAFTIRPSTIVYLFWGESVAWCHVTYPGRLTVSDKPSQISNPSPFDQRSTI